MTGFRRADRFKKVLAFDIFIIYYLSYLERKDKIRERIMTKIVKAEIGFKFIVNMLVILANTHQFYTRIKSNRISNRRQR